jgi:hypothetical protein
VPARHSVMQALFKSVKGLATPLPAPATSPTAKKSPVATATSSSEYPGTGTAGTGSPPPPSRPSRPGQRGGRGTGGEGGATQKRGRSTSASISPTSRGGKKPSLAGHLRHDRDTWVSRAQKAEEELAALRSTHAAMEKEFRTKETKWARDRVGLDQQLLTQTKRGDDYKEEVDRLRAERDDARRERNALQAQLATAQGSCKKLAAEVQAVREEIATAREETKPMATELASLRATATYAIPQGSLRVRHTSSRAELQWLSEGELVRASGATADFRAADWRTLQDLMNAQRGEIAHARDMLTEHKKTTPEFDVHSAVYTCVRQLVAGLEDYMRQNLAPHLPSTTSAELSLADELRAAPERSSSCIVVDKLDTTAGGDASLRQELALAQQEAKLYKEFAQQRTADMDRMHRQGAKNADNIREMSATFQELIGNLRDMTLQHRDSQGARDSGADSPQVTLQAAALEQELDDCYGRFQHIEAASDSVKMTKRSEKGGDQVGTSGATGGSRPDRTSSRTPSLSSSSRSSNSVESMDATSDPGGPTVAPTSSSGGGDRATTSGTLGKGKRNPVPSASAERAKARASKNSGTKSGIPLAKK